MDQTEQDNDEKITPSSSNTETEPNEQEKDEGNAPDTASKDSVGLGLDLTQNTDAELLADCRAFFTKSLHLSEREREEQFKSLDVALAEAVEPLSEYNTGLVAPSSSPKGGRAHPTRTWPQPVAGSSSPRDSPNSRPAEYCCHNGKQQYSHDKEDELYCSNSRGELVVDTSERATLSVDGSESGHLLRSSAGNVEMRMGEDPNMCSSSSENPVPAPTQSLNIPILVLPDWREDQERSRSFPRFVLGTYFDFEQLPVIMEEDEQLEKCEDEER